MIHTLKNQNRLADRVHGSGGQNCIEFKNMCKTGDNFGCQIRKSIELVGAKSPAPQPDLPL